MTGNYLIPIFITLLHQHYQENGFEVDNWLRRPSSLGKLAVKHEPAGKERVFAIVDAFTQWLMKPLHDLLFDMLSMIPQDGTFNQTRPLRALLEVASNEKDLWVASLDLSAATDRLPIGLQELLLSHLFGTELARLWARLLVEREYTLPFPLKGAVKYAVGQPMGALSSWASLALTHHFIVQWAHYRVTQRNGQPYSWTPNYAVLGDDVVIVGRELADEYLTLMRVLGVGIGLHKSVLTETLSAEFAKRFVWNGDDVSPISFTELGVAQRALGSAMELGRRHELSHSNMLRVLGVGPFALTRLERPASRRVMAYLLMFRWPWDGGSSPFLHSYLWPWPRKEPAGFGRFSFLHMLSYRLSDSLVSAYAGLANRLQSAPVSRVSLVSRRWFASAISDTYLMAALNLSDDFSYCFDPSGSYNEAVAVLEECGVELECFLAEASTVGL